MKSRSISSGLSARIANAEINHSSPKIPGLISEGSQES